MLFESLLFSYQNKHFTYLEVDRLRCPPDLGLSSKILAVSSSIVLEFRVRSSSLLAIEFGFRAGSFKS